MEILCSIFAFFSGKRTTYGKVFKITFGKFSPPHQSMSFCSNVLKFVGREISEIACYLPDKKKTKFQLPLKLSLLCGSRPKCARASPQQCAHSAPNRFTFGGVIAECLNTSFLACRVWYFCDFPKAMLCFR